MRSSRKCFDFLCSPPDLCRHLKPRQQCRLRGAAFVSWRSGCAPPLPPPSTRASQGCKCSPNIDRRTALSFPVVPAKCTRLWMKCISSSSSSEWLNSINTVSFIVHFKRLSRRIFMSLMCFDYCHRLFN